MMPGIHPVCLTEIAIIGNVSQRRVVLWKYSPTGRVSTEAVGTDSAPERYKLLIKGEKYLSMVNVFFYADLFTIKITLI
jgi:hypothetical protein